MPLAADQRAWIWHASRMWLVTSLASASGAPVGWFVTCVGAGGVGSGVLLPNPFHEKRMAKTPRITQAAPSTGSMVGGARGKSEGRSWPGKTRKSKRKSSLSSLARVGTENGHRARIWRGDRPRPEANGLLKYPARVSRPNVTNHLGQPLSKPLAHPAALNLSGW